MRQGALLLLALVAVAVAATAVERGPGVREKIALRFHSIPSGEVATRFGAVAVNASVNVLTSCPTTTALGEAAQLLAQWSPSGTSYSGTLLVSTVSSAAARDVATVVVSGTSPTAYCGDDTVVISTTGGLAAVNATGAVLVNLALTPQSVAVRRGGMYLTTLPSGSFSDGAIQGWHLPSGAPLFYVTGTGTTPLVTQPVLTPGTNVPEALWLGNIFGNGTILNGSTGAVLASTNGPLLNNAAAVVGTAAAVVATGPTSPSPGGANVGYGVSWTTGEVLWSGSSCASPNGNLIALAGGLVATANLGPGFVRHATFTAVDARTGAVVAAANWTISAGTFAVVLGPVAGSASLVSVVTSDQSTNLVTVIDAATGEVVVAAAPSLAAPGFNAGGPLNALAAACDDGTNTAAATPPVVVVAQTFPSGDGLVRPSRLVMYNRSTAKPIAASAHVLANLPFQLSCQGAAVVAATPRAVVAVSPRPQRRPTFVPASPPKTGAPPATSYSVSQLWNFTANGESPAPLVQASLVEGLRPAAVFLQRPPTAQTVTVATRDPSTGAPRWSLDVCPGSQGFGASVAADPLNGYVWALCFQRSTAIDLGTGQPAFTVPQGEEFMANPAFLPGSMLYTNVSQGVASVTIRTVGGAWNATSITLAEEGYTPTAMRLFQPSSSSSPGAGFAVTYLAAVMQIWSVRSAVVGVDLSTKSVAWVLHMVVAAMPCHGALSTLAGDTAVVVGVDPTSNVPVIAGVDVRTGNLTWRVSLADAIDPAGEDAAATFFATTCDEIVSGVITIATANAVRRISTADGAVLWTRHDERFFVPEAGNTFGNAVATSGVWGLRESTIVSVFDGAWMLNTTTGATMGTPVPTAATGTTEAYQSYTGIPGVPGVALSVGASNVSLVADEGAGAGSVGAAVQMGPSAFAQDGSYAWSGAVATAADGSGSPVAGLFGQGGWFGVFAVTWGTGRRGG